MNTDTARVLIRGRVQGVFFRAFTRETARTLGLKGWVRNLPGGSVEALMRGPRATIMDALALLRVGPPGSHVQNISLSWLSEEDPRNERFSSFEVRH